MLELQCDQIRLKGPQQTDTQDQYRRKPNGQLQPVWRMKHKLHSDGKAADDETDDQNNENGRTITAINGTEILPTGIAGFHYIKKALKKFPLSACRAFAGKPGA
ncbi:MAG: hypothetical protein P1U71_00750 [Sneathiella sp.]|nr:hypothetical protein [Sneathiella sp.]MDF2365770.1 hypothetical protein [Sneathiella sp.]